MLFRSYLARFGDWEKAYIVNFYYAEILYHRLKDYSAAKDQYNKVITRDKKGEFVEDAALGVIYCVEELMLAEGLLYGPSRTLFVSGDGRRTERQDESGRLRELLPGCRAATPSGGAGGPPWRELDLWRERRTISPLRIEVDDDLRRQLRALGYIR